MYKINEFAKLVNRSVKTLQRWDKEGILVAKRNPKNRRYYSHDQYLQFIGKSNISDKKIIAYCRVSSSNQKDDLKNQKEFISQFCLNSGISINDWFVDIGSGLNFKRKYFNQLLNNVESGLISKIIIAHKDRLVRFGFDWFEQFCKSHGCEIVIINNDILSPEQEMIQDLISIIHVFSCRIYGLRTYKKELKKLK